MGKRSLPRFSLENYQRIRRKGKVSGLLEIQLSLFNAKSEKVFEQMRTLEPIKKKTSLKFHVSALSSGEYVIVIQANDRVAQEREVFTGPVLFH